MNDAFRRFEAKLQGSLAAIKQPADALVFDYGAALSPQAVMNALAVGGIAMVRGFIPQRDVQALRTAVDRVWTTAAADVHRNVSAEYADYIVNYELRLLKNFPAIAACPKPVFNLRHGKNAGVPEAGIVDLFKPDVLIPELAPWRKTLETGFVREVLALFRGFNYAPTSFNLYINEGVVLQRDFHIDADQHHIKAFVYLTDVLRLEDGPYCYVPGTHQDTHLKALNKMFNSAADRPVNDMSLVDASHAIACLAPAGTLILSFQSGFHRGLSQTPDARRLMLVELFEPS
jgi:hypothetical protein